MSFLDISIAGNVGSFTRTIKPVGLETEILLKIPKWNLTSIRVHGTRHALEKFCHQHFTFEIATMHLTAIKDHDVRRMTHKTRALRENRE